MSVWQRVRRQSGPCPANTLGMLLVKPKQKNKNKKPNNNNNNKKKKRKELRKTLYGRRPLVSRHLQPGAKNSNPLKRILRQSSWSWGQSVANARGCGTGFETWSVSFWSFCLDGVPMVLGFLSIVVEFSAQISCGQYMAVPIITLSP